MSMVKDAKTYIYDTVTFSKQLQGTMMLGNWLYFQKCPIGFENTYYLISAAPCKDCSRLNQAEQYLSMFSSLLKIQSLRTLFNSDISTFDKC